MHNSNKTIFGNLPQTLPLGKKKLQVKGFAFMVTLVFFLIICILAITIAMNNKTGDKDIVLPGPLWQSKPLPGSSELCLSPRCVLQASELAKFIDDNANPCDDFYQYCCGSFAKRAKTLGLPHSYSVMSMIEENNLKSSYEMLEKDVVGNSSTAEYKSKKLYSICNNDFDNTITGGQQIVQVIEDLGGLALLGTFDETKFDLSESVVKSHDEYMTTGYFTIGFTEDPDNPKENIFQISRSGLGILYTESYVNPAMEHNVEAYKDFIKTVMQLLVRDAGKNTNDIQLREYADDVIMIETFLAKIFLNNPGYSSEVLTLQQWLDDANEVKWDVLLRNILDNGSVNNGTRLYFKEKGYSKELGNLLLEYQDKKVQQHYITWMVILDYVEALGLEYVQAYREYQESLLSKKTFPSRKTFCRQLVDSVMPYALDNLFITNVIKNDNLSQITMLTNFMNEVYSTKLSGWMDDVTNQKAKSKLKKLKKKIGFPDWLRLPQNVDVIYSNLDVNPKDFFESLLNVARFRKIQIRDHIMAPHRFQQDWGINILKAIHEYDKYANEVLLSAGLLRQPLYDEDNQIYLNFGAIGSCVSDVIASSFIYPGKNFNENGERENWWTSNTSELFSAYQKCLENKLPDRIKIQQTDGTILEIETPKLVFAQKASQEIYATEMALQGYLSTMNSKELPLPGMKYSSLQQLFYIAYVQSQCTYYQPSRTIAMIESGTLPNFLKVNLLTSNSAEFQRQFGCSGLGSTPNSFCQLKKNMKLFTA